MFGLGIPEILFIVLLAVLILGPEQMPRAAKLIGQWSGKIRSAATSLNSVVKEDEELRELQSNIQAVRSDLSSVKKELLSPVRETEQIIQTGRHELVQIRQDLHESLGNSVASDSTAEAKTESKPEIKPVEKPVESDFWNKPLNWFGHEDDHRFVLAKPRLLPGEIARQVTRLRMELKPPKAVSGDFVQNHHFDLQKADTSRAMLKRYSLPRARMGTCQMKRIHLKRPRT